MAKTEATESYRLEQGKHLGKPDPETGERELFTVGDYIELTEKQAAAFGDKVKARDVIEAELEVANKLSGKAAKPAEPVKPAAGGTTPAATPTK